MILSSKTRPTTVQIRTTRGEDVCRPCPPRTRPALKPTARVAPSSTTAISPPKNAQYANPFAIWSIQRLVGPALRRQPPECNARGARAPRACPSPHPVPQIICTNLTSEVLRRPLHRCSCSAFNRSSYSASNTASRAHVPLPQFTSLPDNPPFAVSPPSRDNRIRNPRLPQHAPAATDSPPPPAPETPPLPLFSTSSASLSCTFCT